MAVLATTLAARPDDLRGRQLGEFVLHEHIGEGGFGAVYRAHQPILEREAVVKVALQAGTDTVQKFLGEARLASRLDHPFAAHVYAFGAEPDGLLWIAMELVRGTPLDVLLREQGPLPLERAIPFLVRLCEVVHTAHEQGIVHRDLKPANVMVVARAGSVFPKLLDLGIASDLRAQRPTASSAEDRRESLGTPLYMAPEMWLDARKAGPPADIYALGALTYEVLAGKPPFHGRSVMEIAAQHARVAPPKLGEPFPAGLDAAIGKAMAKRPANRYASALELGEALREASGITLDSVNLPQLDELTRDELIMHAPQPVAEAVAALDAARTPVQAREALWQAARTTAQYVALVALAAHARAAGKPTDTPGVGKLVGELRAKGLDTAAWWRLARELVRPFAAMPDAHPLPELVGLFFDQRAVLRTAMEVLLDAAGTDPGPNASADDLRKFLVGAVPALASALRATTFLHSYRLVVATEDGAEEWMGVRRPVRPSVVLARAAPPGPLLVDPAGHLVAALEVVAQVAPPAPGAPPELFLLDGPHRGGHGARLLALPGRFERGDLEAWQRLGLADDPTTQSGVGEDTPPYRGLMTFTESDAGLFFGREREVEGFVNRLRTMPLVAVVGPSGAGKSSFVRAGVLPALGGAWRSFVARPGPTPLAALCSRIATLGVELTAEQLRADPERLGAELRARARAERTSLLVVIDQFEELFTLCFDAAEQEAYATALVRAARLDDESVRVVITLRDDFLVRAAQLAVFRERLAASLQLLTTPVAADLLRILIEPARRAGYEFEDAALPDEMVKEVAAQPAALALLSFTAYQLWQYRDRQFRQLPRKAYKALGGVGGALAQHAEATLADLTDAEQKIVREVFRHLVTSDGTRAVLSRAELLQVAGGTAAEPALEKLIHARLLVAMENAQGGESIEVVHEALLSAWPRVVRWRQEDAESARLRDQIRVAARQWHERDRARGLLWRGEALTEYKLWRARYPGALTRTEEEFGAASVADAARAQRLRRIALGTVLAGLTIALVIFARLRSVAEDNRREAVKNQERAVASEAAVKQSLVDGLVEQGRRAVVERRTTDALLYLDEAVRGGADSPAIRYLTARALEPLRAEVAALRGHTGQLFDIQLSPDGSRVLTASDDGSVRLWDAATGAPRATLAVHRGMPVFARWSRDGARVFTGGGDGAIAVWDAATGTQVGTLEGNALPVNSLALDATGTRLVAGTMAGVARVWDLGTKQSVALGAEAVETFSQATFSPRGDAIVVAVTDAATDTGGAVIYRLDGKVVARLDGGGGATAAVFAPRGDRVATASVDKAARIWDARSGRLLHVLRGHDREINDLAWSPDGATLATAGADQTIRLWDARTGQAAKSLRGHGAQVKRVRYTPDGLLLSVSGDGTAKQWDPARGSTITTHLHSGSLFQLDAAHGLVATASLDGSAKLFRIGTPTIRTLTGAETTTEFVPAPLVADGRAIRHTDTGGEIWDLAAGTVRRVPGPTTARCLVGSDRAAFPDKTGTIHVVPLAGGEARTWDTGQGPLTACAGTAAGELATAGADGSLVIWDAAGQARTRGTIASPAAQLEWAVDGGALLAFTTDVKQLVLDPALKPLATFDGAFIGRFSIDGQRVVTGTAGELAITGRTGGEARKVALKAGPVMIAWSPGGERLYVGELDGAFEVFDATSWERVARVVAHEMYVTSVAVSADGHFLATTSPDGKAKIWSAALLRQLHALEVPEKTNYAAFDRGGRWLVTTDDTHFEVSSAEAPPITPAALAGTVRCRLPFRLDGQVIVPATPACP